MDDFASSDFQQKEQRQNQVPNPHNDRMHGNAHPPPQMYGGDDSWQMNHQLPQSSYWPGQMQPMYQGNQRRDSGPYFHQFQNMNPNDQAFDTMRNNYPPYLHRPNQDPEVAQAMLNLGSSRDGNHQMGGFHPNMNDPSSHFYPPIPPYYYPNMDMQQHMMPGHDHGGYYSNHPMYPMRDPREHPIAINIPPQQHPIAMDKKRKRPSDMPRRPLSAYNFFFSEERERILASLSSNEGEDASEESHEDGIEQNEPESTKKEDLPATTASEPKSDKVDENDPETCGERLLTMRWEEAKIRRPHRKSHGKIAFKELAKLIGNRWRKITPDQKQKFNLLAEKDLDRYNQQMKDYNAKRSTKINTVASNFGPMTDSVAQVMSQHAMVHPQKMHLMQHPMAEQQQTLSDRPLEGFSSVNQNGPSNGNNENVTAPKLE